MIFDLPFVQDTVEFALRFQTESPMKKGHYSTHDRFLHERVFAQVHCCILLNMWNWIAVFISDVLYLMLHKLSIVWCVRFVAKFCNLWVSWNILWYSCSRAYALYCARTCHTAGKTIQAKGFQVDICYSCSVLWSLHLQHNFCSCSICVRYKKCIVFFCIFWVLNA